VPLLLATRGQRENWDGWTLRDEVRAISPTVSKLVISLPFLLASTEG